MNVSSKLIALFTLLLFAKSVSAVECSELFPDALQNSDAGGSIKFNWDARVLNSPDNILDTQNLQDGSGGVSCDTIACSASNILVPAVNFAAFPGGNNISVGYQETLTLAPGDYGALTLASEAQLLLEPGIYTFAANIAFGSQSSVEVSEAGAVDLFANNQVTFNSSVIINSIGGDHFFALYSNQQISLVASTIFRGLLYGRDKVTINSNTSVTGAIAAEGEIELISGARVTYDPTVFGGGICQVTPPAAVLEYRMEELNWPADGTLDSSGNNLHASVSGNPETSIFDSAIPGDPGTCRYGDFDGAGDILRTPDNALLDLTTQGAITAWIYPRSAGSSDLGVIVGKGEAFDYSYRLHMVADNNLAFTWCHTRDVLGLCAGSRTITSTSALVLNQWNHVAIVYEQGEQVLYVDGEIDGGGAFTEAISSNNLELFLGGFERSIFGFFNEFNGYIDEARVYDSSLNKAQVNTIMADSRPCAAIPSLDHYGISYDNTPSFSDASGLTCEAASVFIYAHDIDNNEVAPGDGVSITISSSTGQGYWSSPAIDAGGGTATYTFAASSSSVELKFNHTSAGPVQFDINGVDPEEDPTLTFVDTGFRFVDGSDNPVPNQVAALNSANVFLQAVRKDTDSGSCVGLFADGSSHAVRIGAECNNPSNCAGEQVSITNNASTQAITTNNDNGGAGAAGYTNFSALLFGADSKAALILNYPDVGAISLHAEHDILNADSTDSGADLSGSSDTFVVKPYTLFVSDVSGNPGTTSGGVGFIAAGTDFSVEVEARNANGNRTPNFGNESTAEGIILTLPADALVYPALGVVGSLNNPAVFTGASPAGTFENSTVQWNEVGTMQLQPHIADGDYLSAGPLNSGDGSIWSNSGNIGRFYPDHFRLVSSVLDNACAAGNFSYMSEPLDLAYTLQAESALANAVVTNYDISDGWVNAAEITYQAEDSDDGVERNISGRVVIATPDWAGGVINVVDPVAKFSRQAGLNPEDGPFMDLDIGLQLTDNLDMRALQDLDMLSSTAGDCTIPTNTCTAKQLGSPLRAYFGRMHLKDAFGPETADIPMFWQNEYYNGSAFVLNSADDCAALPVANVRFVDSSAADDALDIIAVTQAGVTSNVQFSSIVDTAGTNNIIFSGGFAGSAYGAPTPTSTVSYVFDVDFTGLEYLSGDWDEDGIYSNNSHPNITVNFQAYRGNDRVIYWRELLQ